MEICTQNYSFIVEKTDQETWEQYYLRCQAIATCVDKHPDQLNQMEEMIAMSHYWIAHKYMKCSYNKRIYDKMMSFFSI